MCFSWTAWRRFNNRYIVWYYSYLWIFREEKVFSWLIRAIAVVAEHPVFPFFGLPFVFTCCLFPTSTIQHFNGREVKFVKINIHSLNGSLTFFKNYFRANVSKLLVVTIGAIGLACLLGLAVGLSLFTVERPLPFTEPSLSRLGKYKTAAVSSDGVPCSEIGR